MTGMAWSLLLLFAACTYAIQIKSENKILQGDVDPLTIPSQVHVTQGSLPSTLIITWVTDVPAPSVVRYGTSKGVYNLQAIGDSAVYTRGIYTSGFIHSCKVKGLVPSTTYFYVIGEGDGSMMREFSLTTLPAVGKDQDLTFTVVGDLGQTSYSENTVMHILADATQQFTIIAGDLSYADGDQSRWDRWSSMFEPLLSSRPFQPAVGNHEIEMKDGYKIPHSKHQGDTLQDVLDAQKSKPDFTPFQAYMARFPHSGPKDEGEGYASLSRSLYYSYSAGPAHFIHLSSYSDYSDGSEQKVWLEEELKSIDRSVTPWVFAVVHAPWYNSNEAHHDEPPYMRFSMEQMLCEAGVDAIFAGHVHAYERIAPAFNGTMRDGGITYINVGDGGNREGLAVHYITPQPAWSLVREASFGHGRIQIVNGTRATWTWHRIQDGELVSADSVDLPHTDPKACIPHK